MKLNKTLSSDLNRLKSQHRLALCLDQLINGMSKTKKQTN